MHKIKLEFKKKNSSKKKYDFFIIFIGCLQNSNPQVRVERRRGGICFFSFLIPNDQYNCWIRFIIFWNTLALQFKSLCVTDACQQNIYTATSPDNSPLIWGYRKVLILRDNQPQLYPLLSYGTSATLVLCNLQIFVVP